MSLLDMLSSTGTLYRPATTRDANQGKVQKYGVVVGDGNFPCDVQPANAQTAALYRQQNIRITATIYFARDIGAEANDKLVVQDQLGNTGIFMVHGFKKNIFGHIESPYQADVEQMK